MPTRNLQILIVVTVLGVACALRASRPAQLIEFAMREISYRYLEPVTYEKLTVGALYGMTDQLDKYSTYVPPSMLEEFKESIDQQFGGIGVEVAIDPETKELIVLSPIVGSPAYHAGIRAGDKILRIDGESTQGMSLADAAERMRGKPGEPVTLTVLPYGEQQAKDVVIVRAEIQVESVLGDTRNEDGSWNYLLSFGKLQGVGYLRINSFTASTEEEMRRALDWLQNHGMKALILDLRETPGGYLRSAVDVCDLFIREGVIVSTRGRGGKILNLFTATEEGTYPDFPMVVLVNQYTASAAEIVAACLQDHRRAAIVGQRTFGKGTVQELVELPGGNGMLKITMATYWRPSNRNINRMPGAGEEDDWGVRPDPGLEVRLEGADRIRWLRSRRQRDQVRLDDKRQPPPEVFDPPLEKALEYLQKQLSSS